MKAEGRIVAPRFAETHGGGFHSVYLYFHNWNTLVLEL